MSFALFEQSKTLAESGQIYESLNSYSKALQVCNNDQEIISALDSIRDLKSEQTENCLLAQKILLIGLASKFQTTERGRSAYEEIKNMASKTNTVLKLPIVIVAGGCNSEVEAKIRTYQEFVLLKFSSYQGTIISGGTISGISGLIGKVQEKFPQSIRTIGYVPQTKKRLIDNRYSEIRLTQSDTFSPLEPLQYWIDILATGVRPEKISLLGINGGRISAFEYRLALALGALVYIVQGSGREADDLLLDNNWKLSKNLIAI